MGIMNDIKRLGITLDTMDYEEIERLTAQVTRDKSDPYVRDALIECLVAEYLQVFHPEVMDALTKDRQNEMDALRIKMERTHDEKGNRICDEPACLSTRGVVKCARCDRYVCSSHTFGTGTPLCFACYKESAGRDGR